MKNMTRFEMLNVAISKMRTGKEIRYLEIGTQQSISGENVLADYKVGVDPKPMVRKPGDYHLFHQLTSDEYFKSIDTDTKFDLIFIDGLHTYEQSRRDFENSLRFISERGIIALHDVLPKNKEYTSLSWNGEVFKTLADIHDSGFNYEVVNDDHGLCLVYVQSEARELKRTNISYEQFVRSLRDYNIVGTDSFIKNRIESPWATKPPAKPKEEPIKKDAIATEGAVVDVIILSNAKSKEFHDMTQETVDTCLQNASLPINIIVMEQQQVQPYKSTVTVFMDKDEFNYNAFANKGAAMGNAEWIMVANNDLIFYENWLDNLLAANHPVVSPKCPDDSRQKDIHSNTIGDRCGVHFSGWCFMIKRKLWEEMGRFSTDVNFWCSDNSVMEDLKKLGIEPMVVASSMVKHLRSQTLNTVPASEREKLTRDQVKIYNRVYDKNLFGYGKK